jgi:ABC-type multidrug transport system fused ATPase/permease subunit
MRREAWERWYRPVAAAKTESAVWHALAWTVFGVAFVGAVIFVARGLNASPGAVVLVLAAGSRLSAYVGATVGEIGFLRGIWLDGSKRRAWLEDYAASLTHHTDAAVPDRLAEGIRFDHVSFAYPGTTRPVLDDVSLNLKAGSVVAIVGENGAGKTTLVKLLCRLYQPTTGRILVDGIDRRTCRPSSGNRQRFRTFSGSNTAPTTRSVSATSSTRRRARRPDGCRTRRCGRCCREARMGLGPIGADVAGRRRGQLRPVAEAGARAGVHA